MLNWVDIWTRVLQASVLRPLFFLIYIIDLSGYLTSNPKLLADDIPLFPAVTDANATANQINNDLHNISRWAFLWKMSFNFDPSNHTQEDLGIK